MKKILIVSTAFFLSGSLVVTAQDKKEKKDNDKIKSEQHVIIRKKDGEKATIVHSY
ncbi:MAG: hypothetical protein HYX40_13455 [Sphingobacteriales bacterium]|nr:hypothetical protein [Sphingobacteriales bacterium]